MNRPADPSNECSREAPRRMPGMALAAWEESSVSPPGKCTVCGGAREVVVNTIAGRFRDDCPKCVHGWTS
jgi:hypothetical protein